MGWFNILKVNRITNRDKSNFAKLKKALKKEMGYEKFSQVEGEGLLDLEKWINGDISSPEDITSDVHPPYVIGDSPILTTLLRFGVAVQDIYGEQIPETIQDIIVDMDSIVQKLARFADYI